MPSNDPTSLLCTSQKISCDWKPCHPADQQRERYPCTSSSRKSGVGALPKAAARSPLRTRKGLLCKQGHSGLRWTQQAARQAYSERQPPKRWLAVRQCPKARLPSSVHGPELPQLRSATSREQLSNRTFLRWVRGTQTLLSNPQHYSSDAPEWLVETLCTLCSGIGPHALRNPVYLGTRA